MDESTVHRFNRREFLAGTSMLGAATLLGLPRTAAAEPPPETKRIRVLHTPAICLAPQYLAEELLFMEGLTETQYIRSENTYAMEDIVAGRADFGMWDAPGTIPVLDAGQSLVVIGGIHAGCYELFASRHIRGIKDLRGKTIAVYALGQGSHVLMASILAYVGMDPKKDVNWVAGPRASDAMQMFVEGKADAFIGFPPHPQELRAKGIEHVILNTTLDRPWSQYFCCMLTANRHFVETHPVATKRVLRALLKAADICAQEPERVARYLVTKGYEPRYEIGLEVLKSVPYRRWREANPEDTLRFHALRLHEVGMIKSTPQKIITQCTDWRFLNELKKELKA